MTEPTTSHDEIETTYPETSQTLDALIRTGARRMLMAALEAEVEAYIEQRTHLRDENGHALVVRNGKARKRTLYCGAGTLSIRTPRVQDKVGPALYERDLATLPASRTTTGKCLARVISTWPVHRRLSAGSGRPAR